jgi:hypothetical protein
MTTTLAPSPAIQAPQQRPDEYVVVVSLEDIREGRQALSSRCAIARAFHRQYGEYDGYRAHVSPDGYLYVPYGGEFWADGARDWIRRFDRSKSLVSPERFVFRRVDTRPPADRQSA